MISKPTLVSHHLCPYVQRVAIALREKAVPFERRDVDLAHKPAWFTDISPLGKVPLLYQPAVIKTHRDRVRLFPGRKEAASDAFASVRLPDALRG